MSAQTPVLLVLPPLSPLPLRRLSPTTPRRVEDPAARPITPTPAVLWRESLSVTTGPLASLEGWATVILSALTLPVVALSQSGLWHLLTTGALDRAVRAFLLLE